MKTTLRYVSALLILFITFIHAETTWTTGAYENNQNLKQTLTVPKAEKLIVTLKGETEAWRDIVWFTDENGDTIPVTLKQSGRTSKWLSGVFDETFAVNGSSITVNFKSSDDVTKHGVTVRIVDANKYSEDTQKPTINFNGALIQVLTVGDTYMEESATASDNIDGDITANITTSGTVDVAKEGIYNVTYSVSDNAGNKAEVLTRTIYVIGNDNDSITWTTGAYENNQRLSKTLTVPNAEKLIVTLKGETEAWRDILWFTDENGDTVLAELKNGRTSSYLSGVFDETFVVNGSSIDVSFISGDTVTKLGVTVTVSGVMSSAYTGHNDTVEDKDTDKNTTVDIVDNNTTPPHTPENVDYNDTVEDKDTDKNTTVVIVDDNATLSNTTENADHNDTVEDKDTDKNTTVVIVDDNVTLSNTTENADHNDTVEDKDTDKNTTVVIVDDNATLSNTTENADHNDTVEDKDTDKNTTVVIVDDNATENADHNDTVEDKDTDKNTTTENNDTVEDNDTEKNTTIIVDDNITAVDVNHSEDNDTDYKKLTVNAGKDIVVTVDEIVTLTCESAGGEGQVSYKWIYGDSLTVANEATITSTLDINKEIVKQFTSEGLIGGDLTCEATDEGGNTAKDSVTILLEKGDSTASDEDKEKEDKEKNVEHNKTDENSTIDRFSTKDVNGEILEIDASTGLSWVGSKGANGRACQPRAAATTEEEDITAAKSHCTSLSFAGYSDWRVPTAKEQQIFITGMNDARIKPFYGNLGCPRVIGTDGKSAIAVNTHNSSPVGDLIPWKTLLENTATNFGVKCVRDGEKN